MDFKTYQEKAVMTAIYLDKVKEKYPDLPEDILKVLGVTYVALGLGEVGELQNKVKKLIRDSGGSISDEKREELAGEIGDILWYCANVCEELGFSLNDIAEANIDKLFSRKDRGVLTGSGDNR